MRCYTDGEGNFVLYQHARTHCFKGAHLIHALITLFFMLTFSLIGIVVALTNFDPRMTIGKRTAKQVDICAKYI
jgi:ABC-type sulfate transport system permease component